MRYLLINDKGAVFKKSPNGLDLLHASDLKLLHLNDIQDPNNVEVCRLADNDRVFVLKITKIPEGFKQALVNDKMTHNAFHAVVSYEIKAQLVQASKVLDQQTTFKLLGAIERILARGQVNKTWMTS